MDLLVYVRHYGGYRTGRRFVGMAVGQSPLAEVPETPLEETSYVEFRVRSACPDPQTALQVAVAKAFAARGGHNGWLTDGNPVCFATQDAELRLALEPGFDDPRAIMTPLLLLLRGYAVRADTLVTRYGTPPASIASHAQSGAPESTQPW